MRSVLRVHAIRMGMVLLLLLGWYNRSVAQSNVNTWFRITGNYHVNNKVAAGLELQHRRQQDAAGGSPLESSLLSSLRSWVYVKLNNCVTINLSPIAFYKLYPVLHQVAHPKPGQNEIRISAGVSLRFPMQHRWGIGMRVLEEFRDFSVASSMLRSRLRLDADRGFGNGFRVGAQIEVLYGNNLSGSNFNFDHSRAGISIGHLGRRHTNVEFGYLHIVRKMPTGEGILGENCFTFSTAFSFYRQHKKKLAAP